MPATYYGRVAALGAAGDGRPLALYRVSSRSFPNRRARLATGGRREAEGTVAVVVPKPGRGGDTLANPFVSYGCARLVGRAAVVGNGAHTDFVADRMAAGWPALDALSVVLATFGRERDGQDTPRVAGVAVLDGPAPEGWLGVARGDGLEVRRFVLAPGVIVHVSTNGHTSLRDGYPSPLDLPAGADAETACRLALDTERGPLAGHSHPVTAVAALARPDLGGFELACCEAGA